MASRTILAALLAVLLPVATGACTDRKLDPSDPGYNASGAPGAQTGGAPNGPRPYRPLGDESPF